MHLVARAGISPSDNCAIAHGICSSYSLGCFSLLAPPPCPAQQCGNAGGARHFPLGESAPAFALLRQASKAACRRNARYFSGLRQVDYLGGHIYRIASLATERSVRSPNVHLGHSPPVGYVSSCCFLWLLDFISVLSSFPYGRL